MLAAEKGHASIAEVLIEHEARVDICSAVRMTKQRLAFLNAFCAHVVGDWMYLVGVCMVIFVVKLVYLRERCFANCCFGVCFTIQSEDASGGVVFLRMRCVLIRMGTMR